MIHRPEHVLRFLLRYMRIPVGDAVSDQREAWECFCQHVDDMNNECLMVIAGARAQQLCFWVESSNILLWLTTEVKMLPFSVVDDFYRS